MAQNVNSSAAVKRARRANLPWAECALCGKVIYLHCGAVSAPNVYWWSVTTTDIGAWPSTCDGAVKKPFNHRPNIAKVVADLQVIEESLRC